MRSDTPYLSKNVLTEHNLSGLGKPFVPIQIVCSLAADQLEQ